MPPQALDAELSVLGGLLLDENAFDEIADIIEASDFYNPAHKSIYQAIYDLKKNNGVADLITVQAQLEQEKKLNSIGGQPYLLEIAQPFRSSANISTYAKLIKEKSVLRGLIGASSKIIERAYQQDFDNVTSFIDEAETAIFNIGSNDKSSDIQKAFTIVDQSIELIEARSKNGADTTGVPTGFNQLNQMTTGLQKGELVIVAARPSMGKTAFALTMAQNMALREKKNIIFFSLEMGKESIMMRLLSQRGQINMQDLRTGKLRDRKWADLITAGGEISESDLYIDDTSAISPFELRAKCRRHKAKHGLDLIMIDYLQLMRLKTRVESREREVAEISSRLKELAKELQVPVVALAQLNRGVEARHDKRPLLSDLRESGSIEQDADLIMMLYREDYYEREESDNTGDAECIIVKHRNGPTGSVKLTFDKRFGLFEDASFQPRPNIPIGPPPSAPNLGNNNGFHSESSGGNGGGNPSRNFAPGADADL